MVTAAARAARVLLGTSLALGLAAALPGAAQAKGGPVDGVGNVYYLNDSLTGSANRVFAYGSGGDEVFFGDWDGDGVDTPLVRRGATFHVRNSNSSGPAERVFVYGRAGDTVLTGDWDGNGTDTLAVRRGAEYHVKNSLTGGPADVVVVYGRAGDRVLVGDWDGSGTDTLAVRRDATYHVKNSLTPGAADRTFVYGRRLDLVMVGDWDGDGADTLGVRRGIVNYLKNSLSGGGADATFAYGQLPDNVVVGDWDGDGTDTLGLRRPPSRPSWLTGTVTDLSGVVPYSIRYDPRNGRLAPSQLCLIPFMPSHYLHCRALPDLLAFHRAYQARFGERLPIDTWDRSTYRTLAQQQQTYAEIGPPIAARPGTSPHGWGFALDMYEGPEFDFGSERYEWMRVNGPRFGWENLPWHREGGAVPEYWHFDYVR
jgi:hypothetical protein